MLLKIQETADFIKSRTHRKPKVGIILGTGLGGLVHVISEAQNIPYSEIPNFPVSTVKGHKGQLILGTISGTDVLALQGRFHFYEGYSMQELTFPVRVMKSLGVELLLISNASGGLNTAYEIGDCMFVTDHINLMGTNPLIGKNYDELGPRFPDMKEIYNHKLINQAVEIATRQGIRFQKGIYAAVTGPTFETPAEYAYMRILGADAVGMSTVPEAIVARHMGMDIFAISVITDLGVKGKIMEITHEDVLQAAGRSEPMMTRIIEEMLRDF